MPAKKDYEKPAVIAEREIEALTTICDGTGGNTMQDKLTFDPTGMTCLNPMT